MSHPLLHETEYKNSLYKKVSPGMLCSQEITRFHLKEEVGELFQEVEFVGLFADHGHELKALGERGSNGDWFRWDRAVWV